MTKRLDPIVRDQRREARYIVRTTTAEHPAHHEALSSDFLALWCRHCRYAHNVATIALYDALLAHNADR